MTDTFSHIANMDAIDITHTTPSKIFIRSGKRVALILGEALTRLPGQPDFIIYAGSLKSWSVDGGHEKIPLSERDEILQEVVSQLTSRGWRIEIEE